MANNIKIVINKSFHNLKSLILLYFLSIVFGAFSVAYVKSNDYIEKSFVKEKIKNVVNSNANLDDIRVALQSIVENDGDKFKFYNDYSHYKKDNINLLVVFNDIKTDLYTSSNSLDNDQLKTIERINSLSILHQKINPFDSLDEVTKRNFKYIVEKIEEDQYNKVKDEINTITHSIKEKNSLIEKYLSSSNLSFYISLVALIFSVIATIWQLWANRRDAQNKYIEYVIDTYKDRSNQNHEK